ncbi:hypothetical protein P9314_15700 [Paenibacillus validus]|uniref:N-acetyltransferase domain-containing protein n=1 Tax=Paenibacillus validus TaxID=44253 RepID=A0A7X3CSL5_9BACL|nr:MULTISPECIES: hypothetical protein [Paenibacillus]MED4602133.1 hypothetical protein [Paenibacillus validus]MED4608618.1 hypothetical protein [Paenibacillus validus]MUG70886.1 hypothetical protein [Paenibacillus validus]
MKIALHNELPGEAQFRQWIDSMAGEADGFPVFEYETICQSGRIIAAYDQERLVGLGRLSDNNAASQMEFSILPEYRNREIEMYMRKLLPVASSKSSVHS